MTPQERRIENEQRERDEWDTDEPPLRVAQVPITTIEESPDYCPLNPTGGFFHRFLACTTAGVPCCYYCCAERPR